MKGPIQASPAGPNDLAGRLPSIAEPAWRTAACLLLTLAAIQLALGPKIQLSQWTVTAHDNAALAEGAAWLDGRLDIPHPGRDAAHDRMHDTAYFDGKVFNVFPPMMTLLTVLLAPLHRMLIGDAGQWLQTPFVLAVYWPLPLLGFLVFRKQVGDSAWAGLLTLAWMGGTAVLPNLAFARTGYLGQINHVLSQTGLLLVAADIVGRKRIWPGLIGLAISAWSRQMTALYALPLLFVARGRRRLGLCLAGVAVIAAPLLTLNYLKFGNPLDFGYQHIYVNRSEEPMADRCRDFGVFSSRFIGENLWYIFFAPPTVEDISPTNVKIEPVNSMGTGLFATTPLAMYMFLGARGWWPDRNRRLLVFGSAAVIVGLLFYHSPGYLQSGYNRFALDFLPVWFVVFAGQTRGEWRTWLTLACAAYSLLYFQAIVPDGPIISR